MQSSRGLWATPEARQLRVGQHLGQLEDATRFGHPLLTTIVVVCAEAVAVEAAHIDREDALNMTLLTCVLPLLYSIARNGLGPEGCKVVSAVLDKTQITSLKCASPTPPSA